MTIVLAAVLFAQPVAPFSFEDRSASTSVESLVTEASMVFRPSRKSSVSSRTSSTNPQQPPTPPGTLSRAGSRRMHNAPVHQPSIRSQRSINSLQDVGGLVPSSASRRSLSFHQAAAPDQESSAQQNNLRHRAAALMQGGQIADSAPAKSPGPPYRRASLQVNPPGPTSALPPGPRSKVSMAATALKVVRRRSVNTASVSDPPHSTTQSEPPGISGATVMGSFVILVNDPSTGEEKTAEVEHQPVVEGGSRPSDRGPGRSDENREWRNEKKNETGTGHRTVIAAAVAAAAGPPNVGHNGKGRVTVDRIGDRALASKAI
ncbi:hypothetical protein M427DRAFT_473294 [Gonapodya prolifera JEL478]|uniref:Uncharacterized protein n=1 Tax=Gonapodya prolifera (strain JEL478) TaxID=1344416 RepID=A0A139ARW5_GONPJ|nr:hypothetical protein M427DRAFT_473294 [Gonapodya prolifera JEL478]|eukprot:KXS19283.1 hypothetical protein M427DRAFT_473294 [Gonapodya prolifera JEL478]